MLIDCLQKLFITSVIRPRVAAGGHREADMYDLLRSTSTCSSPRFTGRACSSHWRVPDNKLHRITWRSGQSLESAGSHPVAIPRSSKVHVLLWSRGRALLPAKQQQSARDFGFCALPFETRFPSTTLLAFSGRRYALRSVYSQRYFNHPRATNGHSMQSVDLRFECQPPELVARFTRLRRPRCPTKCGRWTCRRCNPSCCYDWRVDCRSHSSFGLDPKATNKKRSRRNS